MDNLGQKTKVVVVVVGNDKEMLIQDHMQDVVANGKNKSVCKIRHTFIYIKSGGMFV